MAMIQKIRQNSWLLVVLIALGLLGFLVMDMTSGQQSVFGGVDTDMGEVNGTAIDVNEFNNRLNNVFRSADYAQREQLWNFYIDDILLKEEASALGLGVGRTELIDREFGINPDPAVTKWFINQQTGQVDRQQINQVQQAIESGTFTDPQARYFWSHVEKEVIKSRLQSKLNSLVSKAMYTPAWMAQLMNEELNQKLDLAYVRIPYSEVDNSEVEVKDADIAAFLKENPGKYEREEEVRVISYVTFPVEPSAADSMGIRKELEDLAADFSAAEDDSLFVEVNDGQFPLQYLHEEDLPESLQGVAFGLETGSTYGPYLEGRYYRMAKLVDRKPVADSVRSRHILRRVDDPNNTQAIEDAKRLVDSLKTLIETGVATFDTLAKQFGQDGTAAKGGDLDFAVQGSMVPSFNQYIFHEGEIGELGIVETQFGIHLVEVTDRRNIQDGVRMAFLNRPILPGEETRRAASNMALEFAADHRDAAAMKSGAAEKGLQVQQTAPRVSSDYSIVGLGSGPDAREIIRWAFSDNTDPGDVSADIYAFEDEQFLYENKYVVAALENIQKPGLPSVSEIRPEVETEVLNRKKADLLASRIQATTLESIANQFATQVDTARGIAFSAGFVPGIGREPQVIAAAFSLGINQLSEPVAGQSGVFVLNVFYKQPVPAVNMPQVRRQASSRARTQVAGNLMNSLRADAEVEDNRARFNY